MVPIYQVPGYTPNMYQQYQYQPVSSPVQQQLQPTQMSAANTLQGRMVTSREEALGVPVDFSGQPMLFPDLAHGVIYYKQFNAGTGSSDFREFKLSEAQNSSPAYATQDDLDSVRYELKSIREEVSAMKKPVRGADVNG